MYVERLSSFLLLAAHLTTREAIISRINELRAAENGEGSDLDMKTLCQNAGSNKTNTFRDEERLDISTADEDSVETRKFFFLSSVLETELKASRSIGREGER